MTGVAGLAMLSAFFGLDGGLPPAAAVVCPPAPVLDGMPLVFRSEIDQSTLQPWDFTVTTRSGRRLRPLCATTLPAEQESEDRTVLLIGQLGDAGLDPPVRAAVTGSLRAEGGGSLRGVAREVTPLEAGPRLVYAERATPGEPAGRAFVRTPTACPAATAQVVRVTWDGGVSRPGGGEVGDRERRRYRIAMADGTTTVPAALGDLGDSDNNHLLCLSEEGSPRSVTMDEGVVADPRGDVNPATTVAVG